MTAWEFDARKLDAFIRAYIQEHNFNGTILIRWQARTVYHQHFGLANRPFQVPVTAETRFKIASVTKLFTAVLILQLYEQGRLDVRQTINAYLPDYTGEGAGKVTVHHLLNHTSGLKNIDTITSQAEAIQKGINPYQKPYTTADLLTGFCSAALIHEPGTVFDYNNGEYLILGKIIEALTGQTYEQALQARILQPLGMTDSGLLYQYQIIDRLADSYFMRDDLNQLVNDLPAYIENWYAAGAMYATAADLLTFAEALFDGHLLKPETMTLMLTPGLDHYGYSVWIDAVELNGRPAQAIKRPGHIMGAQAMLYHIPAEALTVIILSNTDTTPLDDFVSRISRQLVS